MGTVQKRKKKVKQTNKKPLRGEPQPPFSKEGVRNSACYTVLGLPPIEGVQVRGEGDIFSLARVLHMRWGALWHSVHPGMDPEWICTRSRRGTVKQNTWSLSPLCSCHRTPGTLSLNVEADPSLLAHEWIKHMGSCPEVLFQLFTGGSSQPLKVGWAGACFGVGPCSLGWDPFYHLRAYSLEGITLQEEVVSRGMEARIQSGHWALLHTLEVICLSISPPPSTKIFPTHILEFPLWHNGIGGVSDALGLRLDPRPGTVG